MTGTGTGSTADDVTAASAAVEGGMHPSPLEAELQDRLMRALAETENTRQRGERHVAEARMFAVQDFARELLPVADNLRRALASPVPPDGSMANASLLEGVRATERLLTSALARFGVRRLDVMGHQFDPKLHEAMSEVDDASRPAGNIAGVLEDGYVIHDRSLRPARVTVAKARPQRPAAD